VRYLMWKAHLLAPKKLLLRERFKNDLQKEFKSMLVLFNQVFEKKNVFWTYL